MIPLITLNGIDQAISSLNYSNRNALKSRLLHIIRQSYSDESSVERVVAISPDELIKSLWNIGDNRNSIRNKTKNFNCIKSSLNADLKRLHQEGKNPEGIIIGPDNTFAMSEEAKDNFLEKYGFDLKAKGDLSLDQMMNLLKMANEIISGAVLAQDAGGSGSLEKLDRLKDLLQGLSETIDSAGSKTSSKGPGTAEAHATAGLPSDADSADDGVSDKNAQSSDPLAAAESSDPIQTDRTENAENNDDLNDLAENEVIEEIVDFDDLTEDGLVEELDDLNDSAEDEVLEEIEDFDDSPQDELVEKLDDFDDSPQDGLVEELDDFDDSAEDGLVEELDDFDDSAQDELVEELDDFDDSPQDEFVESLEEDDNGLATGELAEQIEDTDSLTVNKTFQDVEYTFEEDSTQELGEGTAPDGDSTGGDVSEAVNQDDDPMDADLLQSVVTNDFDTIEEVDDLTGDELVEDFEETDDVADDEIIAEIEEVDDMADSEITEDLAETDDMDDDEIIAEMEEVDDVADSEITEDLAETDDVDDEIIAEMEEADDVFDSEITGGFEAADDLPDEETITEIEAPDDLADDEIVDEIEALDDLLEDETFEDIEGNDIETESEWTDAIGLPTDSLGQEYSEEINNKINKDRLLAEEFDGFLGTMDRYFNHYILVPEGTYLIGNHRADNNQTPEQRVQLAPFYIGRFPITNALFEIFVEKTGYKTYAEKIGYGTVYYGRFQKEKDPNTGLITSQWNTSIHCDTVEGACWYQPSGPGSTLHNKRAHPVVQVTIEDALAFAAWTGKRLPTEQEWEAAARTANGWEYPWGQTWQNDSCNVEDSGVGETAPVDQYVKYENNFGIADTLGNVLEWTWNDSKNDSNKESNAEHHVAKGGSWVSGNDIALFSRVKLEPEAHSNILGFRCVAY